MAPETVYSNFIQRGLFYAELHTFLERELSFAGFGFLQINSFSKKETDIIIRAANPKRICGEKNKKLKELASVIEQRWNLEPKSVRILCGIIKKEGLNAAIQAESLRVKLQDGLSVRRAANKVIHQIMRSGAKGAEIIVTGKMRASRAKSMKFSDGYMIKAGDPYYRFTNQAVRHLKLKQGTVGIKVIIMNLNPADLDAQLPDVVRVVEDKEHLCTDVYADLNKGRKGGLASSISDGNYKGH